MLVAMAGLLAAQASAQSLQITRQPASITRTEGHGISRLQILFSGSNDPGAVFFSVTAAGSGSLTYQWQKDGVDIAFPDNGQIIVGFPRVSGADTELLNISDCMMSDAGVYRVKIRDSAGGEIISESGTLTVTPHPPPSFIVHPKDVTVTEGTMSNSSLSATIAMGSILAGSNEGPLTCVWQKDGADVSIECGVDQYGKAFLETYNFMVADSGTYRVAVTNRWGRTSHSNPATLTILPPAEAPVITKQPTVSRNDDDGYVNGKPIVVDYTKGGSIGLYIFTSGVASRFQWQKDGVDLEYSEKYRSDDYTNPQKDSTKLRSLCIRDLRPADSGKYRVVVWNSTGTTVSQEATLNITYPTPAPITTHAVSAGRSVALTADISGNPPPAVQWEVSTDGGNTWSRLANNATYTGVNTGTLGINAAAGNMSGNQYRCALASGGMLPGGSAITLDVAPLVFPNPASLVCVSGMLYVTDDSLHTVQAVDLATSEARILAGSPGQTGATDATGTAARFNQPKGISADAEARLFLADTGNALIRTISPDGVVATLAGSPSQRGHADGVGGNATFSAPTAIFLDTSGSGDFILVADATSHTIRSVCDSGTTTTRAGVGGVSGHKDGDAKDAYLNRPSGIAKKSFWSSAYVAAPLPAPIQAAISNNTSDPVTAASVTVTMPNNDYLYWSTYVADSYNHVIRELGSPQKYMVPPISTLAGLPGVSGYEDGVGDEARFNNPGGMAIDSSGNIYVADTGNSTIRFVTPEGQVLTLAGLPGITGLKDGVGEEAWFNHPSDVALGGSKLYIADTGNAAIRELDLYTGQVVTLNITAAPASSGTVPNPPITPGGGTNPGESSGGGGGGMVSYWLMASVAALLGIRRVLSPRRKA
ncbi:sugar lactone lactonase YvrE [Ereboglobus sp. PH5-10]|nr:sugar lactone lactonase YvrE [Ereboglobus sp. PH5-10]